MAAMAFQWSLAALKTLMAEDQMDQHATVLRAFSVVELWRLRRVCRAFHRWGTAALAALPRVVAVGGQNGEFTGGATGYADTAGVEVLDLSTHRWSSGAVPALPEGRGRQATCSFGDGRRVVVAGGGRFARTALQWAPGTPAWAALPDMAETRNGAAAVRLPDGRVVVIGGYCGRYLASGEALAADGSGWSALTPMGKARTSPTAAVLPCGKVLVAGGFDGNLALKVAELWDPATGVWSDLPPMAEGRGAAGCCVLRSGQVAVVGGYDNNDGYAHLRTGEVFDPEAQTWQPLPPMAHERQLLGVVAVAGGLLAVGGNEDVPNELFDEETGRWFELPHPMADPRYSTSLVSLPAAALAPPPAAGP